VSALSYNKKNLLLLYYNKFKITAQVCATVNSIKVVCIVIYRAITSIITDNVHNDLMFVIIAVILNSASYYSITCFIDVIQYLMCQLFDED